MATTELAPNRIGSTVDRLPPTSFFVVSAVFHYLGPSFAVLLFAHVGTVGGCVRMDCAIAGWALVFAFAFANCAGFMLYVIVGHRIANRGGTAQISGIDQLGAAMLIAAVAATPFAVGAAGPAFTHPVW